MRNFRPDKKLKRKRAWKRWRKTRNILENWTKQESNRIKAGLTRTNLPVQFAERKKYPTKTLSPAKRKELIHKLMKESEEKAAKQKQETVLKLKWYQKLYQFIKKICQKIL